MCRFNGVRLFGGGTLKGSFGCSCSEDAYHCMGDGLIFFEIEEQRGDQMVLMETHDALMICKSPGASGTWDGTAVEEQDTNNNIDPKKAELRKEIPGWGAKSGTEDDKEALRDIITSELKKPENLSMSNLCRINCLLVSSFENNKSLFRFGRGSC